MKNKWRILKIAVTVIIFGFLLSFSMKRFNNAPLKDISVNLEDDRVHFLDKKEVEKLVHKNNPENKIGNLDIPRLEKTLNQMPAVDSANVYLDLNGRLNVDIRQRIPVFRLGRGGKDYYVDTRGAEFPISNNYSYPCMLVTGDIPRSDYAKLGELVQKIDADEFCKKYFVGISKAGGSYFLLTDAGNYKVELGDLDNIDFKVKGFKAFVEKYLVNQDPQKYSKISVKYNNQIVTTLNPGFKENDSTITAANKEITKTPVAAIPIAAAIATKKLQKPNIKVHPKDKPKTKAKKPETKAKKKNIVKEKAALHKDRTKKKDHLPANPKKKQIATKKSKKE